MAVFKIVENIPVEKDKLHIVARCFDIWSWTRCKILVGILLGPQDLLLLRDDIFCKFTLYLWQLMKESFFLLIKNSWRICLKPWFLTEQSQQLMWTIYWKYLQLWWGHWCILHHFWLWMVCHCFCFIVTRDSIPIQVFLRSLMFSLKNLVKHFSFALWRSVGKRFL